MIDKSEIVEMYKHREADIDRIISLSSQGSAPEDIGRKVRVSKSYVVEVLKKGKEQMLHEIRSQYGLKLSETEEIPKYIPVITKEMMKDTEEKIKSKKRSSQKESSDALLKLVRKKLGFE